MTQLFDFKSIENVSVLWMQRLRENMHAFLNFEYPKISTILS